MSRGDGARRNEESLDAALGAASRMRQLEALREPG